MKNFLLCNLVVMILCVAGANLANAQGLCAVGGGGFSVTPTEGCNPLSIQVTNTTNVSAQFVEYYLTYSSTTPGANGYKVSAEEDGVTAMTYVVPAGGTFTLLQRVFRPEGFGYFCTPIKVYPVAGITGTVTSCGGGKIKLTLEDNPTLNAYDYVKVDWENGSSATWAKGDDLTLEHLYSNTNVTPTIKIRGWYNPGTACEKGAETSIPVTFQQPQLSSIAIKALEMRADGSLTINYTGVAAISTEILYSKDGGNSYISAARRSSGGNLTFRQAGLSPSQVYLVKLASSDLCGGMIETAPVASMTVSGNSGTGVNGISWSKFPDSPDFKEYQLFRDGTLIHSTTDINEITFTDENVQCDDNYEYQITAVTNKITSISAPVAIKTVIANPQPITSAYVSVGSERAVQIHADVPGGGRGSFDLTIDRTENGANAYKRLLTLYNENEYTDLDVNTSEKSYCYRFIFQNACGQRLPPTAPVCTILLQQEIPNLSWNAESPFVDDIDSYQIIRTGDVTGTSEENADLRTTYVMSLSGQQDQQIEYRIQAKSATGDLTSLSNPILINSNVNVYVPSAFSPNGDNFNDVLEVKGSQFQSFDMSIFNRWGELLFHTEDISEAWDGRFKEKYAPVGYYLYKMTLVNSFNQTIEKSGTFMLLR